MLLTHAKLFADDTAIILEGTNLIQLQDEVSKELITTDNWMKHNRLSLNYSKTTYLVIGKDNLNNSNFHVQIDKHVIPTSEVVKYLGIKLNNKLKWDDHAELVVKKFNRAAGIISKIRHYAKRKTLINLYYSFVYPHLVYGVIIWGNAGVSALRKTEVIQNRILRLITFTRLKDHVRVNTLYKKLGILKIQDIYMKEACRLMHLFHDNLLRTKHIFDQ